MVLLKAEVSISGITLFLFGIVAFTKFVKATGYLHDRGLECLFRSPMSFFDTTPVGRIMNRFSSDIDILDDRFPRTFRVLTVMGSVLVGTIIAIVVVTPLSLAVVIPMLILYIVVIVSVTVVIIPTHIFYIVVISFIGKYLKLYAFDYWN